MRRVDGALAARAGGEVGVGAAASTGADDGGANATTVAAYARMMELEPGLMAATAEAVDAAAAAAKDTDGLPAAAAAEPAILRRRLARDSAATILQIHLRLIEVGRFKFSAAAAAPQWLWSVLPAASGGAVLAASGRGSGRFAVQLRAKFSCSRWG